MTALTVHSYGAGPRVTVLLHGLSDAGTTWPDLVARWRADRRILAPDLRGHGSSPRFDDGQLARAPEVLLADVVELLEAQPEPVVLVGHSLGGTLALRAASARPATVRALVLEDPARPDGGRRPDPDFAAALDAELEAVTRDRPGQVARMLRETPWSRAEVEAWADSKPLVDRRYVREGLVLGDAAWEELFDALTVPTLLVIPSPAPMAPDPTALRNPALRTVVVPGAGHCVRRDRPDAYHRAVDAFLAEVLAGSGQGHAGARPSG